MTIPSTPRKAGPYTGNGVQTSWPFTFKVFAQTDVQVTIADATGTETVLTLGAYAVTLNPNQETSPGGSISYLLPDGYTLAVTGKLPLDQPLDLPSGGNFSPLALENELDRLAMQIQQVKEEVDRSAKVPVTSSTIATDEFVGGILRLVDSADNVDTVADNIANVNTVADDIANVNIVAANLSGGVTTEPTSFTPSTFNGTGAQTAFTLPTAPLNAASTLVFIDGVRQEPTADYTVAGTTLTFTTPPPAGTGNITALSVTTAVPGALPADSVTAANLQTNAVTTAKIAADAVTTAKIADGAVTVAKTSGFGTAATLNVGTGANQVVQLNGSGALPAVSGANLTNLPGSTSNGEFRSVQIFTTVGANTYTPPFGLKRVKVTVVGGGGGGGGTNTTTNTSASGGGGGGAAIKYIEAASLGVTETVTVGAPGTGGSNSGGNGGAGGTSSFGAHCSATGGGGGTGSTTTTPSPQGGAGGVGSSGTLNYAGSPGLGADAAVSGAGGASILSGGGRPVINTNSTAMTANTGGGAAGSHNGASTARSASPGSAGVVIVEEFF